MDVGTAAVYVRRLLTSVRTTVVTLEDRFREALMFTSEGGLIVGGDRRGFPVVR